VEEQEVVLDSMHLDALGRLPEEEQVDSLDLKDRILLEVLAVPVVKNAPSSRPPCFHVDNVLQVHVVSIR